MERAELSRVFDPSRPGSRPNAAQDAVFRDIGLIQYRYVVAGNQSGKSALAAREIAWILNRNHPSWVRPAAWGTGPLKIIIAGQDRKMMELELWQGKLRPFLDQASWREVRQGQALAHVEHRETGDLIIFISHADSSEKNRKHMQGYVAHYVWLDEMPASIKVLEELQRRVDSNDGFFLATFTPKFRNLAIKKLVEAVQPPVGKRYRMSKLDNPLFAEHRQREVDKLAGHSDAYIAAVMHGDWMPGDGAIYEFVPELHGGMPEDYNPGWRHVLVVDPATESKLGLTLWAEDPRVVPGTQTKELPAGKRQWWCVRAEYVEGIYTPTKIILEVERRVTGVNIMERRADTAASWYIRQAADMPAPHPSYTYLPVEHKNDVGAKDGFIRDFQQALGTDIRVADWCLPYIDEMQTYERDPDTGRIRAASKYHLIDSGHYFVQRIPPATHTYVYASWDDRVYQAHLLEEKRQYLASRARRGGKYTVQPAEGQEIPNPLPRMPQPGGRKNWRRKWQIS